MAQRDRKASKAKTFTISDLKTLYRARFKGDISTGIPVLIIFFLCGLYAALGDSINYLVVLDDILYLHLTVWLQFITVGLIATEEFEGDRFVISDRVSTSGQLENADFDDRLQPIRTVVNNDCNGTVVREFTGSESAATMDREDLDTILEMAESDDFDVLAVRNLDRLSRANPWDTIDYLIDLRETGITLYEHPKRFFAWDDPDDFHLLAQKLLFSRQWYQRLEEGRIEGVTRDLKNGQLPYSAHFGYTLDENRNITLDHSKAPILYKIFELYERIGTVPGTYRAITDRLDGEIEKEISKSKIETVLSSKICIGKLEYEGVVRKEIPDLAAVPEDLFERVQLIQEGTSRDTPDKIPEQITEFTRKFGIEYVQSLLEQISFRCCKKCGGKLDPYSKTEILGIPVEKVQCEDCGYDGPLISSRDLREIHQTAPLRCPFCYHSEEFDVEESDHGLEMYRYNCRNCSHQFHTTVKPNKYRRYQKYPNMGVDISNNVENSGCQGEPETSETDRKQSELTDQSRFG